MINERLTRKYCCEDISLIANYEMAVADETQTWEIHHKLEIQDGKQVSMEELIEQGLYYGRPAEELVFLTKSEHSKLHSTGENNPLFGKHLTVEHKQKLSKALSGENHPLFGKHHSEESKQKIADARRGKPHPLPKYKWQDSEGNIHIMCASVVARCHPSWTKIVED